MEKKTQLNHCSQQEGETWQPLQSDQTTTNASGYDENKQKTGHLRVGAL